MGILEVIKTYRALGRKEFTKKFMEGVNGITQLEQAKIQQNSTWISLAGVVLGIGATLWNWKSMWWVVVILLGGFGVTVVQLIGGAQRIKLLKDIDAITKEVDIESDHKEVEQSV